MPELLASGDWGSSISAVAESYRRGERSPTDVLSAALGRIELLNDQLAAFSFVDAERAEQQARESARRWSRGEQRGCLDGIPVALKDNIAAAGMPSHWGAAGTSDEPPRVESCVVTRLREAGAVLVGKTTMSELGLYASGASSRYADARNPWDPDRTAGGSSGGATAAVASGMCTVAIGSDGAGSIRMPASFCGVVGMKPTGGRVPVLPARGRNPVAGPIARSVRDAALVLQVIAQPDARDHFASPFPPGDLVHPVTEGVRDMRIGYVPDIGYGEPVRPQIAERIATVVADLQRAGAIIETCAPVFDTDISEAGADAQIATLPGAAAMLVGERLHGLLPETKRLVAHGQQISLASYLRAVQSDAAAVATFSAVAQRYDVLVTPTMPRTAFDAGTVFPADARRYEFGYAFDFAAFVHIANKAEVPACTVPCGWAARLPIGIQVIGKRYGEADVLRVAAACETAAR